MNWEIVESGPADAAHTVLLLPGGMCTAAFYQDVMDQPSLAGVRLVAATLPGFGGTQPPEDLSLGHYARLAAELTEEQDCDAVVGTASAPTWPWRWLSPPGSPVRWYSWRRACRGATRRWPCAC